MNDKYTMFDNYYQDETEEHIPYITIDGYKEGVDEGTVIAKVYLTEHGDVVINREVFDFEYEKETVNNLIAEAVKRLKTDFEMRGGRYFTDLKFDNIISDWVHVDYENCSDTFKFLLENNIPEMSVFGTFYINDKDETVCHCDMWGRHNDELTNEYKTDYIINGMTEMDFDAENINRIAKSICAVFCKETCEDGYYYSKELTINKDTGLIEKPSQDKGKTSSKDNFERG